MPLTTLILKCTSITAPASVICCKAMTAKDFFEKIPNPNDFTVGLHNEIFNSKDCAAAGNLFRRFDRCLLIFLRFASDFFLFWFSRSNEIVSKHINQGSISASLAK
jgi:hypothetical protein